MHSMAEQSSANRAICSLQGVKGSRGFHFGVNFGAVELVLMLKAETDELKLVFSESAAQIQSKTSQA